MKKLTMFLSLAASAVILSGCYVSPYYYHHGGGYGAQCPPPIKVNVDIKKKKAEKNKKAKCKPVCKPACEPACKPACTY